MQRRHCFGLTLCWPFALAGAAAWASDGAATSDITPADAQVQVLDKQQAEQERLRSLMDTSPKAYQDKFMAPSDLALGDDAAKTAAEDEGQRNYMLELGAGFDQFDSSDYGNRSAGQFGLRSAYSTQTLNYGNFLFQADVRNRSGDPLVGGFGAYGYATQATSGRVLLQSQALPLTERIFANTSVGDSTSELTDALARTYRLALGTDNVRGVTTQIFAADFDLRAGVGERGYLIGSPYAGFEKSEGSLGWLGYTQHFDDDRFAGVQIDRASAVASYFDNVFSTSTSTLPAPVNLNDVTSWAAAVGYGASSLSDGATRGRVILLGSRTSPDGPITAASATQTGGDASGLFLEGSWRFGNYRNEFGAYKADPNLYFGDYQLTTGNRGAYWRIDSGGTRLNWGAGIDYDKSAPYLNGADNLVQIASSRLNLSGNIQYQFDRNTTLGASVNVSDDHFDASSAGNSASGNRSEYASFYYQTRFFDWPRSRFSLTAQNNEQLLVDSPAATGNELQWEQDWIGGKYETLQPEFTTTLGIAHDASDGIRRNYPTAGVQFRYWFDPDFNINGNLHYTSQSGGLSTSRGLSGTLNLERALSQRWRLGAAASLNQARVSVIQTSLTAPLLSRSNEKSVYVYLRWEGSDGSGFHVAGIPSGSPGSGRVSGTVFYDANRDGTQQGGERGVAGVEVILDERFRTKTDAEGHFDFAQVSTGQHRLNLNIETVPLPWGTRSESSTSIDVSLRGQAFAQIPVVKVSD